MHTLQRLTAVCVTVLSLSAFPVYAVEEEQQRSKIPMEDVQRFSNAINQIKKYYVKKTDDKKLFDSAIKGMLSGLDPHSSYLDEDAFKDLQTSTAGEFGGLGIEVTLDKDVVKVISPIADTPAYKAGLKAGDYIIKIGNKSTQGISLKDAVELMRGKAGSTIDLTILRKGENKPLVKTLIREVIQIKSVKSALLDKQYGYVQLIQFQSQTAKDMENALAQLKQEAGGNLKGLVLDLRNNPGGLLDSAIQIADDFIDTNVTGKDNIIVYTQGRLPGSKFTAVASPGDIMTKAPIVVLINSGSASASEIVAGALKDNKRAVILGTKSFGKGSVQTILPLDEKRAIKLTTALYYTPSGNSIQAKGIMPDIVVDEVKIASNNEDSMDALNYSEADLQGHIGNPNANPTATDATAKKSGKNDENLLHQDYQLYAALTILKGLAVAKQ